MSKYLSLKETGRVTAKTLFALLRPSWKKYLAQSEVKKSSKIEQDFKNLLLNFAYFLRAIVKV